MRRGGVSRRCDRHGCRWWGSRLRTLRNCAQPGPITGDGGMAADRVLNRRSKRRGPGKPCASQGILLLPVHRGAERKNRPAGGKSDFHSRQGVGTARVRRALSPRSDFGQPQLQTRESGTGRTSTARSFLLAVGVIAITRPSAASCSTATRFSAHSSSNCCGVSRRSGGNRRGARASKGEARAGKAGAA